MLWRLQKLMDNVDSTNQESNKFFTFLSEQEINELENHLINNSQSFDQYFSDWENPYQALIYKRLGTINSSCGSISTSQSLHIDFSRYSVTFTITLLSITKQTSSSHRLLLCRHLTRLSSCLRQGLLAMDVLNGVIFFRKAQVHPRKQFLRLVKDKGLGKKSAKYLQAAEGQLAKKLGKVIEMCFGGVTKVDDWGKWKQGLHFVAQSLQLRFVETRLMDSGQKRACWCQQCQEAQSNQENSLYSQITNIRLAISDMNIQQKVKLTQAIPKQTKTYLKQYLTFYDRTKQVQMKTNQNQQQIQKNYDPDDSFRIKDELNFKNKLKFIEENRKTIQNHLAVPRWKDKIKHLRYQISSDIRIMDSNTNWITMKMEDPDDLQIQQSSYNFSCGIVRYFYLLDSSNNYRNQPETNDEVFTIRMVNKYANLFATTEFMSQSAKLPFKPRLRANKIENELQILKRLGRGSCTCLPKHYLNSQPQYRSSVLMDYLLGQSLDLYSKKNTITLCVRTKLQMLYYVAQALRYLKNHGVVHSGLNQQKVLISKNLVAKVVDFGVAKEYWKRQTVEQQSISTQKYQPFTQKSDVYSFGLIMRWLLFGIPVTSAASLLPQSCRSLMEEHLSDSLCELTAQCMEPEASTRPTLQWILVMLMEVHNLLDMIY